MQHGLKLHLKIKSEYQKESSLAIRIENLSESSIHI